MNLPSSSLDVTTKTAASGCASAILRRLLCLHPRDNDQDNPQNATLTPSPKNPPPSPNIVARLMGLDSMPLHPFAPPPDSLTRSRSTNSLYTWPGGFLPHKRTSSDPQIKATLSFREAPTFLRKENDDFLLLSFDFDDGEGGPITENVVKAKMERRRTVEKKKTTKRDSCRESVRENACKKDCRDVNGSIAPKKNAQKKTRPGGKADGSAKGREGSERSMNARKKLVHARRKIEMECSSQDSSPVSVLDHRLDTDGENSPSPESSPVIDTKRNQRDSRRKLPSDLADDASLSIHRSRISRVDGGLMNGFDQEKKKPREVEQDWHAFSFGIAAEDMKKSNWVSREIHKEGVAELAAAVGLELLDLLIREVVVELLECSIAI